MARKKVSEILTENNLSSDVLNKNQTVDEYDQPNLLKTAAAGTLSGLFSTAPTVVGGLASLPEIGYHSVKGLIDEDYPTKDKVLETLANSKGIQIGSAIDEKIKSAFGIDDVTKLDAQHQAALMLGDFAPIIATGGSYGAIKLGQKALNKTIKNATKKAVEKGLKGKAKKQFVKNRAIATDTLMGMFTPGVQVSKDAGKLGKLFQTGLQTAPSLGMNEYIQSKNNNVGLFGDYRESESDEVDRVTLFKDKRKLRNKEYLDELKPEDYVEYEIKQQPEEDHTLRNFLGGAAAVTAAVTGAARYTNTGRKLVNDVLKATTEDKSGFDSLSTSEKLYTTTANRFGFLDKQLKDADVKSEDINAFYRDKDVYTQNAWHTGSIGDVIQLDVVPETIRTKMATLRDINQPVYDELEDYLELARQIQHENLSFNSGKDDMLSTMDMLKTQPGQRIELNGLYKNQSMDKIFDKLNESYQNLLKNNNAREILTDLDKLNRSLLQYKLKMGTLTEQSYQNVLKNRTIFDQVLYKPGIEDIGEQGFITRLTNGMFKSSSKTDRSLDYIENLTPRGTQNSVHNAAKFLDVFEQNFKQSIDDATKNTIYRNYFENSTKILTDKVNGAIESFKNEVEDVFKQKQSMLKDNIRYANNTRNAELFDKYTKELLDLEDQFTKDLQKTQRDIVRMMHIRKVGSASIRNTEENVLTSTHNIADDIIDKKSIIGRSVSSYFNSAKPTNLGHMSKSSPKKGLVPIINGDKIEYYQMDPHFARAILYDPIIANGFSRIFYNAKNFLQSTITGKYAPWFAARANIMTMNEAMLATPTIGSELGLKGINIRGYTKELAKNYKAIHSKYVADQMAKDLQVKIAKINSQSGVLSKADKIQVANYQKQLDQILNTKVDDQIDLINELNRGGTLSNKPINVTDEKSFTLTKDFKPTLKMKQQLEKLYGYKGAEKALNLVNFFVGELRDNPSLSLYTYIAKEVKKQRGLKTLNQDVLDEIAKVINTHVANNTLRGSGEGIIGGASEFIRNYMPYGNIMINSITPKLVASGLNKGIKNLKQLGTDLLDADVRYIDVLKEMQDVAKQAGSNKYLQALFFVSFLPATIQYAWNHSNEDNINSYYSYSDYNKASRLILTNFFGKGRHLTIPLDQEVALSNTMVYSFWDNVLGMSKYNKNDPAFNKNMQMLEGLKRSVGLDFQPAKILANVIGSNGVNTLPRDKINNDLSETAYENGIANQQITALTNTLFGQLGSAFLSAAEEGKVGSRSGTVFGDMVSAFLDKTFGTIGFIQTDMTRNMSLSNETIKQVYKKRNILQKIASVTDKNPEQQKVYDLIKMYNRNRIQGIQEQISLLRKEISHIKANSKTIDGKTSSYYSRKANINELTKQLQQLYKNEYNEYNKLDSLLQQLYGNNISIETFMPQYSNGDL